MSGKLLKNICNGFCYITKAFIRQIPLFLFLSIVFITPALLMSQGATMHRYASLIVQVFAWSFGLSLLADIRKWIYWVILTISALYFFIELFCYFHQGSRICTSIVLLCAQTNISESLEFVSTPASVGALWKAIVFIILILCGYAAIHNLYDRLLNHIRTKRSISCPIRTFTGLLLVAVTSSSVYFNYKLWNERLCDYWRIMSSMDSVVSPLLLSHTWLDVKSQLSGFDFDRLEKSIDRVQITSPAEEDLKVVVVFGESHIKHRSSVYGYFLNTMPHMEALKGDSSLIAFDNVIAYANSTLEMIKRIFSTYDTNGSGRLEDSPLFPAVFKKAGFDVHYYDNQSVLQGKDFDYGCNYFLSSLTIRDKSFDYNNDRLFQFDHELLREYPADVKRRSLIIYHLMGQHVVTSKRFPESERVFKSEDYRTLKGLDENMRQVMADYDNATRYLDKNLYSIIEKIKDENACLIYVPDHGETMYDNGVDYGRSSSPNTPVRLKTEIEVPLFIWLSEKYKSRYPQNVEILFRNQNKDIINTDISHTVMDLAGIKTNALNKKLSLLSDSTARQSRKILPGNVLDYDKMKKDIENVKLVYTFHEGK